VVDSQPAVRATQVIASTPSHWIWDAWHGQARALAERHPNARVTIRWAPGHEDIVGNERADEVAKSAAQHPRKSSPNGALPASLRGDLEQICRSSTMRNLKPK
jgi:ribonuclease HI